MVRLQYQSAFLSHEGQRYVSNDGIANSERSPNARVCVFLAGQFWYSDQNASLSFDFFKKQKKHLRHLICVGKSKENEWFVADLCHESTSSDLNDHLANTGRWAKPRQLSQCASGPEQEALLIGLAAFNFLASHRFCSACGGRLQMPAIGLQLCCVACQQAVFPRTDPAVIMLVSGRTQAGEPRLLLGRHASWPAHTYSALAGFVELGESLEQAVRREVLEEVGLPVGSVSYLASQPWPFPRSLMLGFEARLEVALEQLPLSIAQDELEAAAWFSESALKAAAPWGTEQADLCLPRTDSIAYFMIHQWLERQARVSPWRTVPSG